MTYINQVAAHCQQQGLRFTQGRQQVLKLLAAKGKALTAYELLEQVQQQQAKAKPATIYRALDFLLQHGFVHRLNSINGYVVCPHFQCQHSAQLFICQTCRHVSEFQQEEIGELLLNAAQEHGFHLHSQTVELTGFCQSCQDAQAH